MKESYNIEAKRCFVIYDGLNNFTDGGHQLVDNRWWTTDVSVFQAYRDQHCLKSHLVLKFPCFESPDHAQLDLRVPIAQDEFSLKNKKESGSKVKFRWLGPIACKA